MPTSEKRQFLEIMEFLAYKSCKFLQNFANGLQDSARFVQEK